jgi:hypothetical protein
VRCSPSTRPLTPSDTYSHSLKAPLSAQTDIASLPFTLPAPLAATRLSSDEPDGAANRFGVRAGQSLQEWEKAGWIWNGDPRGWAQWYVRFWEGRRCVDDERQVKRCECERGAQRAASERGEGVGQLDGEEGGICRVVNAYSACFGSIERSAGRRVALASRTTPPVIRPALLSVLRPAP